jgi:cell division transport system permease protein
MRVSTIKYTVQQGLRNIAKNKMFSIASVATMVACIFLFGVFYSLIVNVKGIMKSVEESMAIIVYFDEDATQKQIDNIEKKLSSRDDVLEVKYVSGDEAWEQFQKEYFGDDADAAAGFEENPLEDSDNFEVYLKSVDNQKEVVEYAKNLKGVRKVKDSPEAANTLKNISVLLTGVSAVITTVLLIVAIFLISNTVSMGITVRREEIAIMKYIGAKDSFVRAPFMFEGLLIGLVGAIIPLVLLYFAYEKAVAYVMEKFSVLTTFIEFLPVSQVYSTLLPVGLALGVGIGFAGSVFTIRKHLNA